MSMRRHKDTESNQLRSFLTAASRERPHHDDQLQHFMLSQLLSLLLICLLATLITSLSTVVVVGGGIGGLATAARIASPDTRVIILEKQDRLGGRCGSFLVETDLGTFRHEHGPSLLLLPNIYEELFRDCSGKGAKDYGLVMKRCLPAYQVVFDDGDCISVGFPSGHELNHLEEETRRKMNSYETNGAAKWDEYLTIMGAYLDCGLPNFIQERLDLPSFPAFLYHALRNWCQFWPLKPHSRVLEALFSSTKLQALASFQDLYVGLQPYDQPEQFAGGILRKTAPAVFGLLAAIELHPDKGGVWAPIGGFGVVTKAVTKLAQERNVEIRTETTATKITEEGVFFISKDGPSFLPADLVVVNADLPYATETLLSSAQHPEEVRYDWDDKYDFSSGVIAFHWSVDIELTDLKTHNVFLVASSRENAEASWSVLLDGHRDTIEPFSFYVHRASATDPTAAPAGCDAILVLVPCPTLEHQSESLGLDEAVLAYQQQFDESIISTAREAVLKRLSRLQSLKNLEQHILHEVVDTPATYADKYHLAAGTPFGISHGLRQLSITRPGAESSTHSSLFVGASSRPGNGVPLVFIGAKLVAQKALNSLVKVSS